jgi:hypothetical protein
VRKIVRKFVRSWSMAIAVTAVLGVQTLLAGEVPIDAGALAEIKLPVPEDQAEKTYLGLKRDSDFSLRHIDADSVIIEVFSMYCHICQGEAPKVNQLHKLIDGDPKLRRVKLIGIGTGNTPLEVDVFRKKYNVSFPLFPDDDINIQKAFPNPVRTPTFVVITLGRGTNVGAVQALEGRFESAEEFLKSIMPALSAK